MIQTIKLDATAVACHSISPDQPDPFAAWRKEMPPGTPLTIGVKAARGVGIWVEVSWDDGQPELDPA
jgi:hypothetical protein